MFENADDGERIQLAGDFEDVHGCSESLTLNLRGDLLSVCVTSVKAGDRVIVKRGGGMRDISETFAEDGVLLTAPVPARRELLAALRVARTVPLCISFEGLSGGYRTRGGRSYFLATDVRIAGVKLAATDEDADCELTLID